LNKQNLKEIWKAGKKMEWGIHESSRSPTSRRNKDLILFYFFFNYYFFFRIKNVSIKLFYSKLLILRLNWSLRGNFRISILSTRGHNWQQG
jgi:hypothetical protein